jgi:hypothetical protein
MTTPTKSDETQPLASKLLRGARAIGDYIGLSESQVFYGHEKRNIPLTREGKHLVGHKDVLDQYYRGKMKAKDAAA